MNKFGVILTISFFSTSHLLAQTCDSIGFEKPLVKKLINRQFGNLINPQSNNNIGNFASIDIANSEVNLAGNIIFTNGSILGIKAKGAIIDGFFSIFSNDKLNTKLGIDMQYNFLGLKNKKSIIYDNITCEKYQTLKKKIENDYKQKRIEIEKHQNKILLQIDIANVSNKIDSLKKILPALAGLYKDSLIIIEILKLKQELSFKEYQLKNYPTENAMLFNLDNWKASEIVKAQMEVKISGFKLSWFSIGYGITNNAFRLFDGTLTLDQQISKISYANHSLRLQYSFYRKTPAAYESYFISLGTAFSIHDNFNNLTKVEINETKNYGLNTDDRFINSKYNAYQGSYSKDLKSVSIYGDFYWFLFDDNKGALHLYPEHNINYNSLPYTNMGIGFLMAFKNEEKADNVINSELYINLYDIFDNNHSTERLLIRSDYGIRLTFPINFN